MNTTTTTQVKGLSADYWKYWTGQLISHLGSDFTAFGLPLLIFIRTGSALNLGAAFAISMIPYLLFGLVAGVLVDNLDRRLVLILSNLLQGVAIATIPLADALHILTIGWIYIVMLFMSVGGLFFQVARFSVIPAMVSRDSFTEANARIQTSLSITGIVGPILAGVLLNVLPVTSLFGFDAISFGVAIVSIMTIRTNLNGEDRPSREIDIQSITKDIREGLIYVRDHQLLRRIFLLSMLTNTFFLIPIYEIVFFAEKILHASPVQIGVLFASQGIGVLVLTFFVKKIAARFSFKVLVLGSMFVIGALLVTMSVWQQFGIAFFSWTAFNALIMLINVGLTSLQQSIVPNALLGRVGSVDRVLTDCISPLGVIAGGVAIAATNHVDWIFAICGLFLLGITLPFFLRGFEKSDIEKYTKVIGEVESVASKE